MDHAQFLENVDRAQIVALASRLIATPSTSGNERAVMTDVARWAEEHGISHQVHSLDPERPNLVLTIGSANRGPIVAMNGHLDTVPVSDESSWRSDPYTPTVSADGRKLVGRGASDMKSSVAVMLYVLSLLKDAPLNGQLQAHVVSDEETGGKFGAVHLIDEMDAGRLSRPNYCLIGEKSDLKVRNAERGLLAIDVTCYGRASHTAAARVTGINAIAKAAKAVLALEGDIDRYHPAVGKPVISINSIQGGVAHNVVPGECSFSIDRRLIPGETRDSVVSEITAILDGLQDGDSDFRYQLRVDPSGDHIPANITPETSPVVQCMQQSIRDITGQEPEFFVAWAGATDGRYYRQAGIDTVGYGPGGEGAHGANEAVIIGDLVTQARVYMDTALRLLT